MTWLAEFERRPITSPLRLGGTYVDAAAPWRLVLHTTEVIASIQSLVYGYGRTGNYPHITADIVERRVAQHISLDRSATATKNKPGGVETNRLHAVQVELIWRAEAADKLLDDDLDWIGAEVVAPILRAKPIQPIPYREVGLDGRDGFIARPDGPTRMSFDEWRSFNGVCTHQNVPENDHWDCGRLNLGRICRAAAAVLVRAAALSPTPEEEPMRLVRNSQTGAIHVLAERTGLGPNVGSLDVVNELVAKGVVTVPPSGDPWTDLSDSAFNALPSA